MKRLGFEMRVSGVNAPWPLLVRILQDGVPQASLSILHVDANSNIATRAVGLACNAHFTPHLDIGSYADSGGGSRALHMRTETKARNPERHE